MFPVGVQCDCRGASLGEPELKNLVPRLFVGGSIHVRIFVKSFLPYIMYLIESSIPAPVGAGRLVMNNNYVLAAATVAADACVSRLMAARRAAFGTRSSRMPLAMTISTDN